MNGATGLRARLGRPDLIGFALLAYVPYLLSSPGKVSADTKQYLYLDPGRLLSRAPYLWDPHVGAGTVPHQNIGYLFPMGPYYWLMSQVGVPDWVAQRLWLGSISFAAGAGAMWLLTMLGTRRTGAIAGALVYMLTPYQIALTARLSVILLPWAALPWLVGLTARALARGGWRDPALFAFVALAAGSVSAPSLLLVGVAPALLLAFAVLERRATARDALTTAGRIGVLSAGVSLWWAVGLLTQARDGIPILDVTESLKTVARSSTPYDLVRGLGNWFLSGSDRLGPWLDQSRAYDGRTLTYATLAIPVLALLAAACVRWRHRAYFVALVVVGTIVGVGAWPYDDPSPLGALFKDAAHSSFGLALRNTPRVVPVVVLGLAGLLAAGVSALAVWRRMELAGVGLVAVVVLVAFSPVWVHGYLSKNLERPEAIPAYWEHATATLGRASDANATRVLEIPGSLFAAYRWGNTVDPITPGLTDRPWLGRELLPFGSRASVNLLAALDRRMQEGTFEPAELAAVARLLRSGTILVRSDLQYERYGAPEPRWLWAQLTDPLAPGLGTPSAYGPGDPNKASLPLPEQVEQRSAALPWPPEVALIPVLHASPIVDTAPARRPVVLAGDGDGIVDVAAAGLLDGRELVLYAASLDRKQLDAALARGADLVVTDTNRRRARRWDTLRDDTGATERAGQRPLREDTDDFRLEVFPGSNDRDRTVVEQRGARADATGYGIAGIYVPEDRAARAFDGNPGTSWRVGGDGDPGGERLVLRPDRPVRADRVTLSQAPRAPGARTLTEVRLRFDRGRSVTVRLDDASRTIAGQVVRFAPRTIRRLEVEVVGVIGGRDPVGFSEVRFGGVRIDEVVRVPVALLDRAGSRSSDHRLAIVLSRLRYDSGVVARQDEELALVRRFELPKQRAFAVAGTARINASVPDDDIDALLRKSQDGCRSDLIIVDGRPIAVRLRGDAATARRDFALEGCRGPITLDKGSHLIRSRPGLDTGIDIDRLVLTSARGGAAAADPLARVGAPPPASGARATVVDSGPTSFDVRVRTDGRPFWLVLGQSDNDGWHADIAGGRSLGSPRLVNGSANGWEVSPREAGTLMIHLRWTPQRLVWPSLAISALAVLACAVIVVRTRRAPTAPLTDAPALSSPLEMRAARLPMWIAIGASLVVGVASVFVSRPWMGAAVAVATFVALQVRGGRVALTMASPAVLVLAEVTNRPQLAWLAVLLLAGDLMRGAATAPLPTVAAGAGPRDGDPA